MLQNPSEIKKTIDHLAFEMGFKRNVNIYRKDFEHHVGLIHFQPGSGSLTGLFTFDLSVCSSTELVKGVSFRNIPGWERIGSVLYGSDVWYKFPRDEVRLKEDLHRTERMLSSGRIIKSNGESLDL